MVWLRALRLYLVYVVPANLAWEIIQLPLYTIWQTAPVEEIAFAVLHCTAGDFIIAAVSLVIALALVGEASWPAHRYWAVAIIAVSFGIGYTAYSEWMNVGVRRSWAYSEWMPIVPGTGIGLSPLLQWLLIPALGFALIRRKTAANRTSHAGS